MGLKDKERMVMDIRNFVQMDGREREDRPPTERRLLFYKTKDSPQSVTGTTNDVENRTNAL